MAQERSTIVWALYLRLTPTKLSAKDGLDARWFIRPQNAHDADWNTTEFFKNCLKQLYPLYHMIGELLKKNNKWHVTLQLYWLNLMPVYLMLDTNRRKHGLDWWNRVISKFCLLVLHKATALLIIYFHLCFRQLNLSDASLDILARCQTIRRNVLFLKWHLDRMSPISIKKS